MSLLAACWSASSATTCRCTATRSDSGIASSAGSLSSMVATGTDSSKRSSLSFTAPPRWFRRRRRRSPRYPRRGLRAPARPRRQRFEQTRVLGQVVLQALLRVQTEQLRLNQSSWSFSGEEVSCSVASLHPESRDRGAQMSVLPAQFRDPCGARQWPSMASSKTRSLPQNPVFTHPSGSCPGRLAVALAPSLHDHVHALQQRGPVRFAAPSHSQHRVIRPVRPVS